MPALITWWTNDLTALLPHSFQDGVYAAGVDLLRRWSQEHRAYHGTTHLVELFWALEELESAGEMDSETATLARIAAWFHDAVYDPRAPSGANEADSAQLAREVLTELGLSQAQVLAVEAVIRMTAGHDPDLDSDSDEDDDPEQEPSWTTRLIECFHDADLWILSAPPTRFDAYCAGVRSEYGHVPEQAYRFARAAILRDFAKRSQIYRRPTAIQQWEPRARINLDRELTRLAAPDLEAT